MAKEEWEIVRYTKRSIYILLLGLQLLFNRFISFKVSFRVITSFFAHLPLPIYIFLSLQVYIE